MPFKKDLALKEIKVKKGQILQRKGDLNSKVYHVQTGLLRSYTIDEKGREHIYMFAPENWIIGDSVSSQTPCDLFIDCLEDSVVIQKEKDTVPISDTQKLINRLEVLQKRIIRLMSASSIERYEHFLELYPDIVQRVPQKMVASYLRVTPEALSAAKGMRVKENR
ncbi:MAG: Crp/Fnr family transcriptional regulator [Burkholderiaceae bacterium]